VRGEVEPLVALAAPFAPHIAEELWERLGHGDSLFVGANWPSYDEAKTLSDTVNIAVQVNGRLRATIEVAKSLADADVVATARAHDNVARHLEGVTERKVIFVEGRLVNFVVS
jgi:leucyl-tRNA synthetase